MFWVGNLAVCVGLFVSFVQASPPKPSLIEPFPLKVLVNELFQLKPVAGHHFNLKAPHRCGSKAYIEATPRLLKCQFSDTGSYGVVASICDDKKTFCRTEKFTVQVSGNGSNQEVKKKLLEKQTKNAVSEHAPTGFITNDPKLAQDLAREKDRLLLIDFFGIWCPPCNHLDEYVFSREEFQKATSDLVKVRLDADADISFKWKDHFRVSGYPTVIVANHKLEEIGRWESSSSIQKMLRWVEEQKKSKTTPIASLLRKKRTAAEKLRVAKWYYSRADYEKTVTELKGVTTPDAKRLSLLAQKNILKNQNDKEKQESVLVQLLTELPQDVDAPWWFTDLADLNLERAKSFKEVVLKTAEQYATAEAESALDLKLQDNGYIAGYYLDVLGSIHDLFKEESKAREFYLKAAQYFENLEKSSSLSAPRSARIEAAYYYFKAQEFTKAKKLYERSIESYPEEFTFNFFYANTLFKLKEYDRAFEYVNRAEQHAYGDNWLRAVNLKGEIDLARGRKKEAQATLENALAQISPPSSTQVRTHRYVARMRELLAQSER